MESNDNFKQIMSSILCLKENGINIEFDKEKLRKLYEEYKLNNIKEAYTSHDNPYPTRDEINKTKSENKSNKSKKEDKKLQEEIDKENKDQYSKSVDYSDTPYGCADQKESEIDESFLYEVFDSELECSMIYENISLEIDNFNNMISESGTILESENRTLIDKLRVLLKKVQLFFKKVKQDVYTKFIDLGYKKLNSLIDKINDNNSKGKYADFDSYSKYYGIHSSRIDTLNKFIRETNEIGDKLNDAYDTNDKDTINNLISSLSSYPDLPIIPVTSGSMKDKTYNNIVDICNFIKADLKDATNTVYNNMRDIEHNQTLLTRKIKLDGISHQQISCSLKMIQVQNLQLKGFNRFINALLKSTFLNIKELSKLV